MPRLLGDGAMERGRGQRPRSGTSSISHRNIRIVSLEGIEEHLPRRLPVLSKACHEDGGTRRLAPLARLSVFFATLFVIQLLPLTEAGKPLGNPYQILGVTRHVTLQELRKAYKLLVKEWYGVFGVGLWRLVLTKVCTF